MLNLPPLIYKKLLYKASHRGSKELDILLTNFISYCLNHSKEEEDLLKNIDRFLEEEDPSLLDYFFGKQNLPSYVSKSFKDAFLDYCTYFLLEKKQ